MKIIFKESEVLQILAERYEVEPNNISIVKDKPKPIKEVKIGF